jgi:Cu(I)/Ag(I) efflux system periplasmic protein CusF
MEASMRYLVPVAVLAMTLGACGPRPSHETIAMQTSSSAAPVVKSGTGTGVIKAVDPKAGTVTIAHEPIPSIGWPAMTMTFPVADPSLLTGVAAGNTITFDVIVTDNKPVITSLRL